LMVCTIHRDRRVHTPGTKPCHTGLDPVSICLHVHMDPGSSPGMTNRAHRAHTPDTKPCHTGLDPVSIGCHAHMDPGSSPGMTTCAFDDSLRPG
jgi:hypothetical protein